MIQRRIVMQKLRFEVWMARKGLTCQKIVASGIGSEVELMAMADRLGVIPPIDLQGFRDIWDTVPTEAVIPAAEDSVQEAVEESKSSTPARSRSKSRSTRTRTTRKKSNIKDDGK